MWKEFIEDVVGLLCLVVACYGLYIIAWAVMVPELNH
jgi:hypothetical protein